MSRKGDAEGEAFQSTVERVVVGSSDFSASIVRSTKCSSAVADSDSDSADSEAPDSDDSDSDSYSSSSASEAAESERSSGVAIRPFVDVPAVAATLDGCLA